MSFTDAMLRPTSAGGSLEQGSPAQEKILRVECTTWSRDSHGLFDYEARHVNVKKFLVTKSARLFRISAQIQCLPESEPIPAATPAFTRNGGEGGGGGGGGDVAGCNNNTTENIGGPSSTDVPAESLVNTDFLLSIRCGKDGKYLVVPADRSLCGTSAVSVMPQKLWSIVREQNNNQHKLQENDVIKLGRYKLRVKQLVAQPSKREDDVAQAHEVPELRLEDGEPHVSNIAKEDTQCRICLIEGNQVGDPLISPCDCKGSIKFVHLECLRHWINGRLNFTEQQQRPYFVKQLQCELCKIPYPAAVKYKNERMQVVSVPRTEPPFIVLENMVGNHQKGLYVISMVSKKDLKLGRGHESDVRIPDVSISRYHATIRFEDGSFLLEDHNSKFGTLVSLRKGLQIVESAVAALQVGRSVVKFSIEEGCVDTDGVVDISGVVQSHDPTFSDAPVSSDTNCVIGEVTGGEEISLSAAAAAQQQIDGASRLLCDTTTAQPGVFRERPSPYLLPPSRVVTTLNNPEHMLEEGIQAGEQSPMDPYEIQFYAMERSEQSSYGGGGGQSNIQNQQLGGGEGNTNNNNNNNGLESSLPCNNIGSSDEQQQQQHFSLQSQSFFIGNGVDNDISLRVWEEGNGGTTDLNGPYCLDSYQQTLHAFANAVAITQQGSDNPSSILHGGGLGMSIPRASYGAGVSPPTEQGFNMMDLEVDTNSQVADAVQAVEIATRCFPNSGKY